MNGIRNTILLFLAALLPAAAGEGLHAQFIKYGIYAPDTVQEYRSVNLQNGLGRYVLKFVMTRPRKNRPEEFQIRLREPAVYYSFSRPLLGFIQLRTGNLDMKDLVPRLDHITRWENQETAGVKLPLNFNGETLILSFFMKKDSPLLWSRIQKDSNFAHEVKIKLCMVISGLIVGKYTGYDRLADSAAAAYTARRAPYSLSAADRYLILHDKNIMPGTSYDKATGPCLVLWQQRNLQSARLDLSPSYINQIFFNIRKEAGDFEFGLWESGRKYTLAEFREYISPFLPGGISPRK